MKYIIIDSFGDAHRADTISNSDKKAHDDEEITIIDVENQCLWGEEHKLNTWN